MTVTMTLVGICNEQWQCHSLFVIVLFCIGKISAQSQEVCITLKGQGSIEKKKSSRSCTLQNQYELNSIVRESLLK